MISKTQFMDALIVKPVVDALIQTLYNQMEDLYYICVNVIEVDKYVG